MMNRIAFLIPITLLIFSCQKPEDVVPSPLSMPSAEDCGAAGARLQAVFDGTDFCANVNLFCSPASGEITINGLSSVGSTLTLQLDTMAPGTYDMSTSDNVVLFTTSFGIGYMSNDSLPATLTISEHDTEADRIKGSFSGELITALGGAPKSISGSFDMYYVPEE